MRFSILLPVYNGAAYVGDCVNSIVQQAFDDYELLISNDHSTDNTAEILTRFESPRVRILSPEARMSMAEHWEWLLSRASGDWIIFVGQDDALQPYFFDLANRLADLADANRLEAVMSRRAFYFWPGCEYAHGKVAVHYSANPAVSVEGTKCAFIRTLLGFNSYFDLPEMYTTSIVKRSLVDRAKSANGGRFFVTHPQDANIAAVVFSLTKRYLKSEIPLGWVGSSPKSAGMAIFADKNNGALDLKREYLTKIGESALKCNKAIGDFSFGSTVLYIWGALLQTAYLRSGFWNGVLASGITKKIVCAVAYMEMERHLRVDKSRSEAFHRILDLNGLRMADVMAFLRLVKAIHRFDRLYKRVAKNFTPKKLADPGFLVYRENGDDITLCQAHDNAQQIYESLQECFDFSAFSLSPSSLFPSR